MKHVILTRAWSDVRATLGMLRVVEDEHDPIFTLENPMRVTDADSRILPGVYSCKAHSSVKHPNVWEVCNVPGRTAILIHSGNTEKDTQGCILVGLAAGTISNEPRINASKDAIELLRSLLGIADFQLTVVDERNYCG